MILYSFCVNTLQKATIGSIYQGDYNKIYDRNVNLEKSYEEPWVL